MLTLQDRMRIAVETRCDLRTIARAYAGKRVTQASRGRIERAAEYLRLPMPPPPASTMRLREPAGR